MSDEAFDSVTTDNGATLSFTGDGGASFSLPFDRTQRGTMRLPRPDGPCWIGLHLPPALWDQVAGVLEAWKGEPFWLDRLPVSDAGYMQGGQ